MSSIDERVVQMKFDNKQFESGVKTTLAVLEALKKGLDFKSTGTKFSTSLESLNKEAQNLKKTLNFKDALQSFTDLGNSAKSVTSKIDFSSVGSKFSSLGEKIQSLKKHFNFDQESKSISDIESAANKVDFTIMANAIDGVKNRFNNLGIVGITVLQNLTNMAMSVGASISKALSIQSVIDGYHEYETQINSVQTILANTQKEGTNIDQVNAALDTLNTYADKTIYNFTEMTRNIGTFTAAGVGLQTSVDSIQGIANLAAISGSTSQQASTAMYQLSQAIASGTVKLMDWNSVVNAGMGGQVFQDALIRTSEHLQTGAKAAIEAKGSFRESLQEGWLTTEVLTETLKQFSLNVESAEDYEAAISDLVSQGYTQEEAENIANMARTAMDAATKVKTFSQLIDTLKEALGSGWAQSWRIIIGDFEEAKELWTEVSDVLSGAINDSAEARNNMLKGWADLGGRTALIEGLKNIIESMVPVMNAVSEAFRDLFPRMTSEQLYDLTIKFRDFAESLKPSEERLNQVSRMAKGLFSIFALLKKAITTIITPIASFVGSDGVGGLVDGLLELIATFGDFFTALNQGADATKLFSNFSDKMSEAISSISSPLKFVGDLFKDFGNTITDVANIILDKLSKAFQWINDNVGFGNLILALVGGLAGSSFIDLKKLIKNITDFIDNFKSFDIGIIGDLKDNLSSFFGELGISLSAFTGMVNAVSLVAIAASVAILVNSLEKLSEIKYPTIIGNLPVIAILMMTLVKSFKKLSTVINSLNPKTTITTSIAIVALAEAINIMASALQKISEIPSDKIVQSIGSIFAILAGLNQFMNRTKFDNISLKSSVSLIAMAGSLVIISKAISSLSELDTEGVLKGVGGISATMIAMAAALKVLDKVKVSPVTSVALIAISESMKIVADSLKDLSGISWNDLARGLSSMGIALTELTAVTGILQKISGIKSITGATSVLMLVLALKPIASALNDFASMSMTEAKNGLDRMAMALIELGTISGVLQKVSGAKSIIGATSVLMLVLALKPIASALNDFADIEMEDAKRALIVMGAALVELGAVNAILGKIGGIKGVIAAASVLILVQALGPIAEALQKFGSMSWEEIGRGLVAMGASLGELGIITGLLGNLGGFASLVGAGTILLVSQGLDQIAEALQKFGSMSWEEIDRGLEAMSSALGQIAFGSLLNTLGIIGSFSIAEVAEPLGVLADSIKKWQDVTVPDDLGISLSNLASGVAAFTLSGFGAGTISQVAEPLGVLADSVNKWQDVTVPEGIGDQLKSLADGIAAFSLAFVGGFSISTVSGPLGELAESIAKWQEISIPENMGDQLKSLADGINAFSLLFVAGWSLDTIIGPLGDLADAVSKWDGISVPEGIGDQLKSLADAIGVFSGVFITGWSLGSVTGPLGDLADAVAKWGGISVPEGIDVQLKSLADGISSFASAQVAMPAIEQTGSALSSLGEGLQSLSGIDFQGISSNLTIFSQSIQGLPQQLTEATTNIGNSISNFASSITTQTGLVISAITLMMSQIVGSLNTQNDAFIQAGSNISQCIITGLNTGLFVQGQSAVTSMTDIAQQITQAGLMEFNGQVAAYNMAGCDLISSFKDGAESLKTDTVGLFTSIGSECLSAIQSSGIDGFYQAGLNMMIGLQNGIESGRSGVISAAINVATEALTATHEALDEASPSKATAKMGRYYDQGLINGMEDLLHKVRKTAENVGKEALQGLRNTMSEFEFSTNEYSPKITPVIDSSGLRTLSGLSTNKTLTYNARIANAQVISPVRAMQKSFEQEREMTIQSNNDVIKSIESLRTDISAYNDTLSNMETNMYIDGKKLASSIAKPMNRELGTLSKRGRL